MKSRLLICCLFIGLATSCSNYFHDQSWVPVFVDEDAETLTPKLLDGYSISINFKNDSVAAFHNFRGDWKDKISIKRTSDRRFQWEDNTQKPHILEIQHQSKDSLVIRYSDFSIHYKPMPASTITASLDELKLCLLQNFWEYKIGNSTFEIEFDYQKDVNKGFISGYDTEYTCIVHHAENGKYQATMHWNWNLVQSGNTYILQIGDVYDHHFTYESFYINAKTDSSLITEAWYKYKKANVTFQQKVYDDSLWNKRRNLLTSKKWNVSATSFPQNIDTLLDLGTSYSLDTINPTLTIREADLFNKVLYYKFDSNHAFQLLKSGQIIQEGTWQLFPNGKVLGLYTHAKVDDWYSYVIPDSHIFIIVMDDSTTRVQKQEELYVGKEDKVFKTKNTIQMWR